MLLCLIGIGVASYILYLFVDAIEFNEAMNTKTRM